MRDALRGAVVALLLAMAPELSAAALSPVARQEIEALLNHLEASGCRFNRNGTWYAAAEAQKHLRKKQDYLVRKGMLSTAESFIELAASRSSASGKPYLVQCGAEPAGPSSQWLREALQRIRQQQ